MHRIALVSSLVVCVASVLLLDSVAQMQTPVALAAAGDCSPAPCVLPPTQVSSSVGAVFEAPIIADPTNPARMIVGSLAPSDCGLGFYVTNDGGSNWNTVCMSSLNLGGQHYIPAFAPVLAYDRNGVAYIGGFYLDDNGRSSYGFEGFQKSSDGTTWSNPAPAVILQNYDPSYCWMAADDSPSSPYVNSVYISCVMVGPGNNNSQNQVVVAYSRNGGAPATPGTVPTISWLPGWMTATASTCRTWSAASA
jgi:hypothetical protein